MGQQATEADAQVANVFGVGQQGQTQTQTAGQAPEGQEAEAQEAQEPETGSIDDLPDWAAEEIRRLRRENATSRVKAREAARKTVQTPAEGGAAPEAALRAAEERGRSAARMENGIRLAGAEVKAALAASALSSEQILDIVTDLDLTRFVQDDGDVDEEAIRVLAGKYTALIGAKKPAPRVGHGRQNGAATQPSTAQQFAETLGGLLG